ncbi:MAG TPA: Rieske (2Fe-2S) protein [Jiangellales bacterium]|nr:Rieske (2Fe-2S) protein [Jiangellales bacterium]
MTDVPTDVTTPARPRTLPRRTVLVAVAAGAGGLVVACGSAGESTTGGAGQGAGATTDAGPDTDTGDAGADTQEDASPPDEGSGAEVLAATADVPVGGGVIGGGTVVTQPTEGEFRGFSSTCTHQGCTVASVADGVISCPCHGSRFSAEDGSVEKGPATAPLPEVAVSVEGGNVVRA